MKKLLAVTVWVVLGFVSLNAVARHNKNVSIGYFGASVVVLTGPMLSLLMLGEFLPCALNCEAE